MHGGGRGGEVCLVQPKTGALKNFGILTATVPLRQFLHALACLLIVGTQFVVPPSAAADAIVMGRALALTGLMPTTEATFVEIDVINAAGEVAR